MNLPTGTLLTRAVLLSALFLSILGCMPLLGPCSGTRLDQAEFCALSPAEQVGKWRQLYEGKVCIAHEQHFRFLDCIVQKGCAGADAVTPLLQDAPRNPFLVDDAIYVVRFVHMRTCNLRNHEALRALQTAANSDLEPAIRQRAEEAIQTIRTTETIGSPRLYRAASRRICSTNWQHLPRASSRVSLLKMGSAVLLGIGAASRSPIHLAAEWLPGSGLSRHKSA
jgi:hypothetical protein